MAHALDSGFDEAQRAELEEEERRLGERNPELILALDLEGLPLFILSALFHWMDEHFPYGISRISREMRIVVRADPTTLEEEWNQHEGIDGERVLEYAQNIAPTDDLRQELLRRIHIILRLVSYTLHGLPGAKG